MIEAIFIAREHRQKQQQVLEIEVIKGAGIVGDRNFGKAKWPGQNITFIELEEIEIFNEIYGQQIALGSTRRNVITKGIPLNELVGKEFTVGEVKCRGVELCEPCSVIGSFLENESISRNEVVKAFVGKGGLRADVLSNGRISVGMKIEVRKGG